MLTRAARCKSCKNPLASDNPAGLCSPCGRRAIGAATEPPAPPAHFWTSRPVKQAVESQDFGGLLRVYRESFDPPITQATLGTWLGIGQGQVSRIEAARTVVTDLQKLVKWSRVLGAPSDALWFSIPPIRQVSGTEDGPVKELQPQAPSHRRLSTMDLDSPSDRTRDDRVIPGAPGRLVGRDDASVVLEMTRSFRQIDNRYGAGSIRSAVDAYLSSEVRPALLGGRFTRGSRRYFQLASVELHQLAGWIAYDVGDDSRGKLHLRDALSIASDAGDDALASEMLAAMSHQAAFSRRSDEAIDLAIAARRSAIHSGAPALHAESFALEAQGLALRGDKRSCISALQRAERAFLSSTAENTPPWLRYFDGAYLSAKFAHALRDVGQPTDAERFARNSLQMTDGYERGKLFNTALLATILIDAGQLDEAVAIARSAVKMAGQVRSSRARGYLQDIAIRLSNCGHCNDETQSLQREIGRLGPAPR
jgi:hypothetical protein